MIRVIIFLLAVAAVATGLGWLADRPGSVLINWEGYEVAFSVFHAVVGLALLLVAGIVAWSILRGIWTLPAGLGSFFNKRREKRGLDALTSGMIAIGSGDRSLATRYAVQARKSLPNEPMTHILRAQAAQLSGDRATARRIFEAMLGAPDTEPLGLRGLYLEAEREGEQEAARQFAERAMAINPKLSWPIHSLFDIQCKEQDWVGALATLATARKHGHIQKAEADRKRAVLLTAQAQASEVNDPERAMKLADEAHTLAHDLIPATAIAGRLLASRGNVQKASKVLQQGWRKGPHPDIAVAYAYARVGDSPRDRLNRVKQLASLSPHSPESPIAVAMAAIEARDFAAARDALEPMIDGRLSSRVCTLMAKIEGEEGNTGAVREWLARAVNAPRDPAWTADGVVADDWAPLSPVTGELDAFRWRVPVEAAQPRDSAILHEKIEELVKLGARPEAVAAAGVAGVAGATATDSDASASAVDDAQTPSDTSAGATSAHNVQDAEIVANGEPTVAAATVDRADGPETPETVRAGPRDDVREAEPIVMAVSDAQPDPAADPQPDTPTVMQPEPHSDTISASQNQAQSDLVTEPARRTPVPGVATVSASSHAAPSRDPETDRDDGPDDASDEREPGHDPITEARVTGTEEIARQPQSDHAPDPSAPAASASPADAAAAAAAAIATSTKPNATVKRDANGAAQSDTSNEPDTSDTATAAKTAAASARDPDATALPEAPPEAPVTPASTLNQDDSDVPDDPSVESEPGTEPTTKLADGVGRETIPSR